MGLLVECPECKTRNSTKPYKCGECKECKANKPCKKPKPCQKCLRRERIGPNKEAAEHRLREIKSAKTEGRYIKKCPDAVTQFKELARWYLELPEVKAKDSYQRDVQSLNRLLPWFGDRLWWELTSKSALLSLLAVLPNN
jgi:hypothetical protein